MRLNELAPSEGSRSSRKRKGRGVGSGLGKTAGRGSKAEALDPVWEKQPAGDQKGTEADQVVASGRVLKAARCRFIDDCRSEALPIYLKKQF